MREDTINKALLEAAEPIREGASVKAPRRTGKLAQNIISSVDPKQKKTVNVGPSKDVFYGLFVEKGTSISRPKPFLRPAFDSGKRQSKKIFADAIKKILEAVK